MYEWLKGIILPILRITDAEPHPPSGYDPHAFMRIMRASPMYLHYRLFYWKLYAIAWTLGVLAASMALLLAGGWLGLLVIPLFVIAAFKAATLYVISRLDYEMRWYVVTDRSLLIREGVWATREITLTFANAQNVRVTQGPLQRYFGFSNVEVDTAGGASNPTEKGAADSHRAVLRGLENPSEVRALILELLQRQRTAGLGDPDDRGTDPRDAMNPSAPSQELIGEIWEEAKRLHGVVQKRVGSEPGAASR